MQDANRRPIAARSSGWAQATAKMLARSAISPNQISCISVLFAAAGVLALLGIAGPLGQILCAVSVVMRLLCNLFDGMVAVEGGKSTATGALFNDVPDRLADSLFLVALGYTVAMPWLGWLCALLAALTAYIRMLGGSLGQSQDFRGPMAKPHRMWLLCAGLLIAAALPAYSDLLLIGTAGIIAAGSALTCMTRLRAIARQLDAGSGK